MTDCIVIAERRPPKTVDEALAYAEHVIQQYPEHERTWTEVSLVLLAAEVARFRAALPEVVGAAQAWYEAGNRLTAVSTKDKLDANRAFSLAGVELRKAVAAGLLAPSAPQHREGDRQQCAAQQSPQAAGGIARAAVLSPERRREIAAKAAAARWAK